MEKKIQQIQQILDSGKSSNIYNTYEYTKDDANFPLRIAYLYSKLAQPCPGCQLNYLANKLNWTRLDWNHETLGCTY